MRSRATLSHESVRNPGDAQAHETARPARLGGERPRVHGGILLSGSLLRRTDVWHRIRCWGQRLCRCQRYASTAWAASSPISMPGSTPRSFSAARRAQVVGEAAATFRCDEGHPLGPVHRRLDLAAVLTRALQQVRRMCVVLACTDARGCRHDGIGPISRLRGAAIARGEFEHLRDVGLVPVVRERRFAPVAGSPGGAETTRCGTSGVADVVDMDLHRSGTAPEAVPI